MFFLRERKNISLVKTLSVLSSLIIALTFLNSCGGGGSSGGGGGSNPTVNNTTGSIRFAFKFDIAGTQANYSTRGHEFYSDNLWIKFIPEYTPVGGINQTIPWVIAHFYDTNLINKATRLENDVVIYNSGYYLFDTVIRDLSPGNYIVQIIRQNDNLNDMYISETNWGILEEYNATNVPYDYSGHISVEAGKETLSQLITITFGDSTSNSFNSYQEHLNNNYVVDAINSSNQETNLGDFPPLLEGLYSVSGQVIDSDVALLIGEQIQSEVCLYNQTPTLEIDYAEGAFGIILTATGNFITGINNDFTIWQEANNIVDSCSQSTSVIFTGTKSISDLSIRGLTTVVEANGCGDVYPGLWYQTDLYFDYIGTCAGPNDL